MTRPIINASGISKLYQLGRTNANMTFQERIRSVVTSPSRNFYEPTLMNVQRKNSGHCRMSPSK